MSFVGIGIRVGAGVQVVSGVSAGRGVIVGNVTDAWITVFGVISSPAGVGVVVTVVEIGATNVFVGLNVGRTAVAVGNSTVGEGRGICTSISAHPTTTAIDNVKLTAARIAKWLHRPF